MSLKSAIVTLGTILEASLHVPGLPRNKFLSQKSSAGVKPRVQDAVKRTWISKEQGAALEQCWGHRNNVHLKLLEDSELDLYTVDHVNAPHAALLVLLSKLKEWNGIDAP
jgi:hypothetical protein